MIPDKSAKTPPFRAGFSVADQTAVSLTMT